MTSRAWRSRCSERFEMRAMFCFDHFPADAGITPEWLHPYRAARAVADGVTVGWFGQLHPREAAARKIKDSVLIGEEYLDRLCKLPLRKPVAREISRYQSVRRDFSLVLDEGIAWETVDHAMTELKIPELVEWRVREVYRDKSLGKRMLDKLSDANRCMGFCSVSPFRRRIGRCAKRSLRVLTRKWWRLWVRRERGCEFERAAAVRPEEQRHSAIYSNANGLIRGHCNVGV